ncbi:hypothetical protein Hanom_Chr13g01232471 [Helianthus anomalus]
MHRFTPQARFSKPRAWLLLTVTARAITAQAANVQRRMNRKQQNSNKHRSTYYTLQ